jgi:sortase A
VVAVLAAAVVVAQRTSRRTRPTPVPVTTDGLSPVVAFLRRRPWARRTLSLLSVGLLVAAAGLLGYPFYTNLYQSRIQQRLDHQLVSPELQQAYRDRKVGTGDALTRIRIPAIGVDVVVVEGTTASALRAGAGHYPQTPLPCEDGNVAIAGHRTTYGKPFHNLDLLKAGDDIILETPIGECTYKVAEAPFVVLPNNTDVVQPTPASSLTLTTCHPKGSASRRLVVRAALQGPAAPA